jgi:hypothetical protein
MCNQRRAEYPYLTPHASSIVRLFGFFLMGLPTAMFHNDLNMGSCILAFIVVNYTPFDIGYMVLNTLPFQILTVSFAQLFRSLAVPSFSDTCFHQFKDRPCQWYPIPVFGPILYPTLLANWGGFITKGLEGYISSGMPWAFQNGKQVIARDR